MLAAIQFRIFIFPYVTKKHKDTNVPNCNLNYSQTLFVIRREQQKLSVFENRELRRTFGLKCGKVTGAWRELY
jgi:hypothetical protein